MSSVLIVLLGLAGFSFGWFVYSRFIAQKIYKLDPNFVTPAHEVNDGVDYVPTNKFVLWGAHFTSVAGAAPIVGPAIAVYWGWVPAVLWVTLGSVFFAGVHDMGALWASSRHGAKSIGALSESVIGKRTRSLFMIVIFLLLLMVNAVFGTIIAGEMVDIPTSVFPAWAAIPVAVAIGFLIRKKANLLLISIIGVSILYFTIYVGSEMPLALPENFLGMNENAAWILILFTYAAIASMLPVWVLLQPRDYINGAQLVVGLILLYGAVFLALPDITAPAFNDQKAAGTPNMFPLLFITIACGALSGFHGIVSSGTSSKQLDKEPDARFVGYLGALGEGSLALITIVAVCGALYAASPETWHTLYSAFGSGGASAFITGGGNLLTEGWGLPNVFAMTLLATMVVLFAGTTMDAGVRLQRYIIQEWGSIYNISILQNNVAATFVAVGSCLLLAFGAGGSSGNGGNIIWPLFGATNQILASLTLLVISIFLMKMKRQAKFTLAPMIFVLLMSVWGSLIQMGSYYNNQQWLLVVLSVAVLIASILVILEAVSVISNLKKEGAVQEADA
ncbi:MAG: carbon starvation protein A [Pseudomonadales bacterium]|nr:carbon starvation protein A [Pseudomonadales bacterium]MCP5345065.1 carbon starvation protein A [Pseudomonadales bacterium]